MGKRKCSVKTCTSSENRPEDIGVTYHRLPSNPINRQIWLKLCQIEQDYKQLFVCSRHFLKADFGNYKAKFMLRPKAVPSIFSWSKKPVQTSSEPVTTKTSTQINKDVVNNKRVRKKKVIPDFVTDDDFTVNAGKLTADDALHSEDSLSDFPPVLEAVSDGTTNDGEGLSDFDQIPNLEPSLSTVNTSQDSLSDTSQTTPSNSKKRVRKPKKLDNLSHSFVPTPKKKAKPKSNPNKPPKEPNNSKDKVSLSKPSTSQSIIKDRIIVQDKCSPLHSSDSSNKVGPRSRSASQNQDSTLESADLVNDATPKTKSQVVSTTIEQKIKTLATSTEELTFEPNTRIEALDINRDWSPATIVEVDYEENEVLVHFDSYSNKYDEWIGINTSSIRAPQIVKAQETKVNPEVKAAEDAVTFILGERCMAYWGDTKKYLATVKEVIDNATYVVKFDDGYIQKLHVSKMTKSSPLFVPIKSSKEERRTKKRKLNVQSLFNKNKKQKSLDTSAADDPSSADEVLRSESRFSDKDCSWYPTFDNGVPIGIPSQIKNKSGIRESIIVPDPYLPEKWEKHVMQREGGKFFSVIVAPGDRKLRCAADIQRYIHEHPEFNYQDYRLDLHVTPRTNRQISAHTSRNRQASIDRKERTLEIEREQQRELDRERERDLLKIIQVDGGFQCPIEGCGKTFRRENLVQMHVKHYHPEFTKFLDSTPNVLDLVYQRLHGDEFEQSPPGRTYDYYMGKGSFTPVEEFVKSHEVEYSKDTEIKKLLNSTSTVELGKSETVNQSFLPLSTPGKNSDEAITGPDLKSLVVTTKSGLKTIPPVKKDVRDSIDSTDGGKKRKAGELLDECSEVEGGEVDQQQPMLQPQVPGMTDHYIEDGRVIKLEQMRKEEIIHCTCGITEEDGLMIQCEICMCWQHAHCNNIYRENEVPEKYVCYICLHPQRQRSSMKYKHDQDWLKHGRLPTGSYHCRDDDVLKKRFDSLKSSHDISGGLIELKDYMHTLKQKIKIAEMKNHPKLYLWSKPWEKHCLPEKKSMDKDVKDTTPELPPEIECKEDKEVKCEQSSEPQPEAPIKTVDCRINLLEHIIHCQSLISERFDDFSKQMDELEAAELPPQNAQINEDDNRIRLTTNMLVRDLGKLKELSQII